MSRAPAKEMMGSLTLVNLAVNPAVRLALVTSSRRGCSMSVSFVTVTLYVTCGKAIFELLCEVFIKYDTDTDLRYKRTFEQIPATHVFVADVLL